MGKIQRKPTKLKITNTGNGRKTRWAKGHSSDSNPITRIHRNAARSRFYQIPNNNKDLKIHDMKMLENMNLNLDDDKKSEDGFSISDADTVATRLSNITNCTNPTFDKVHRIWKSGSKLHSDVLTVLAGVTDAIKAKGGKENETEYFAALLNPLVDPEYSPNLVAATAYLLNLVIRKVPKPILIQQFDKVAEIIYGVVRKASDSGDISDELDDHNSSVLRHLLLSIGYLLELRPKSFWLSPPYDVAMAKMLDALLDFTIHEKPRIRKAAQKSVVQIILNLPQLPTPVSKHCADFCNDQFERFGSGKGKNVRSDITFYVLNFLQHVMHRFTLADLKRTVETIFKVLTLSNNLTTAMAVHCLYMTFRNRPSNDVLPADLNAKIILAIYDFQPSPKDARSCSNWILLITEAHACLMDRDVDLSLDYVPRLAETLAKCLSNSDHAEVVTSAANCMKRIYGDFVLDLKKSPKSTGSLENLLELLEKLLSAQYYSIWPQVFGLFAVFFESTGTSVCNSLRNFEQSLKSIAELRESESFPCKLPAEQAIGAAIRHIGPEEIVAAIPLGLNAHSPSSFVLDFPRSWLLPLLRSRISNARLEFFSSYFLPLAIKIDNRVKERKASGSAENAEIKILEAIECQIWELFPAFCNSPTDLNYSFPIIARALGAALMGRPKLRLSILAGLRRLLQRIQNTDERGVLEKFGKNYLNILLQLYTGKVSDEPKGDYDDDGVRLAVLATVRSYLPMMPADLISKYLEAVSDKLKVEEEDRGASVEKKCRLLDILIVMVPHLDVEGRRSVHELSVEMMAIGEKRIQKKSWRLLEELCGGESVASQAFVATNLVGLQEHLRTDLSNASPATQACRLRCLLLIMENLKDSSKDNERFILSTIPDAVRCLHGSSIKARKCAAKFLAKAVTVLGQWKSDVNAALKTIFNRILFEPSKMEEGKSQVDDRTGSLAAARLLCYEFRNDISTELISTVLGTVCHILTNDNRRSVAQASVEFLKTFVGCFPEITVGQFLDTIVSALCNQSDDCMKHSRRLIRKVVAKLVKRFSYVTVKKFVPEAYQKQLNNIRKLVARADKKRASNTEESKKGKGTASTISSLDDETGTIFTSFTNLSRPETIADLLKDTSDEESDNEEDTKSRGGKVPPVWLKEGDEDEVVDLMDKKFVQQLLATKPKSTEAKKKSAPALDDPNRGFKTAADGRLMITVEKDDNEDQGKNKKRKRRESMESGDGELLDTSTKRVGHHDDYEEDEEIVQADDEPAISYVPGGKGIHRPLSSESKKKLKGEKKSKRNLDPYAYVPLDRKALNKRKKAKMNGELKNIVQGAKKGATKGSKGKKKRQK